jgi:hypothetical protein
MASGEDNIIELIYIIQSINHINKQNGLLFSLNYKVFLIYFNCIKLKKIIPSYIIMIIIF